MKGALVTLASLATVLLTVGPQPPYLVADRNTGSAPASSTPHLLALADGRMIGAADDPPNGRELWISDGTPAGTRLVLDINPGPGPSNPQGFVELDGVAYFIAADYGEPGGSPVVPNQLWRSDGTTAGTWVVREYPAPPDPGYGPVIYGLTVLGDTFYFAANDGEHGLEPWRSDGTPAGTELVKDVVDGSASSEWSAEPLFPFGGRLLFVVQTAASGFVPELWTSDGSAAGTTRFYTFSGTRYGPWWFIRLGDQVLFSAVDSAHGQELWKTDGTETGTMLVKDVTTGPAHTGLIPVGSVNGVAVFGNDNEPFGLWRSDGTEAGTTLLRADATFSDSLDCVPGVVIGDELLFTAFDDVHGTELWASDGSAEGTRLVRDIMPQTINGEPGTSRPSELVAIGDRAFFAAHDDSSGRELWASDGTETGTFRVRDIHVGPVGSHPSSLIRNGDLLYFAAAGELWVSDGTDSGTVLAVNIASDAGFSGVAEAVGVGDRLYFTGGGLWTSDGTAAGTRRISGVDAWQLTRVGPRVYFQRYHPQELWTSDGSAAGTYRVFDVDPGAQVGPHELTPVGLRLYFRASDAAGPGMWFIDTLTRETAKVALPPEAGTPRHMAAVAGRLFFSDSDSDSYSDAIWRTDGTRQGTVRMTTLPLQGETGNLNVLGSSLLFTANDGTHGYELWRSDGTAAGTSMVADVRPGSGSSVTHTFGGDAPAGMFLASSSALFFVANDGVHGNELWRSDGTSSGTWLVADLAPGSAGASLVLRGSLGGLALFSFDDGVHGDELWVSDGTVLGTRILADVNPGSRCSRPDSLVTAGGAVYFAASDDLHGRELWRTDGTAEGTLRVADISPGAPSSSPTLVGATDGLVYFTADDGVHGWELWAEPYDVVHGLRRRVGR